MTDTPTTAADNAAARLYRFDIHVKNLETYTNHELLVLEQLVFAAPKLVMAPHAPQALWGPDNGVAFVIGSTYRVYNWQFFHGYMELQAPMTPDAFQATLLQCCGDAVRAALRTVSVKPYHDHDAGVDGLRNVLSYRLEIETFFTHGRMCLEMGRVFRTHFADYRKGGCKGALVRALMRDITSRTTAVTDREN